MQVALKRKILSSGRLLLAGVLWCESGKTRGLIRLQAGQVVPPGETGYRRELHRAGFLPPCKDGMGKGDSKERVTLFCYLVSGTPRAFKISPKGQNLVKPN